MPDWVAIDGSHGEGGGQILRTALSLSAITGRALRVDHIRAGRREPGLAAQHITAARAVAALCGGTLDGDALGSQTLTLIPGGRLRAGDYEFDVAEAREGGSAGAITLVLQAMLLPLALADGASTVRLVGGTHMGWSPSFHYIRDVWLPTLARMGVAAQTELLGWGWYPAGGGMIETRIDGRNGSPLAPLSILDRGALKEVRGVAVAANLPAHIPQRMTDRARALLGEAGFSSRIEAQRIRATCPGAGIFLIAAYEQCVAGFAALGKPGKASEVVAEEAVAAFQTFHASGAAVDRHLADQLILPAALADGETVYRAEATGLHLESCAWVVEQFSLARFRIERQADGTVQVTVSGRLQD